MSLLVTILCPMFCFRCFNISVLRPTKDLLCPASIFWTVSLSYVLVCSVRPVWCRVRVCQSVRRGAAPDQPGSRVACFHTTSGHMWGRRTWAGIQSGIWFWRAWNFWAFEHPLLTLLVTTGCESRKWKGLTFCLMQDESTHFSVFICTSLRLLVEHLNNDKTLLFLCFLIIVSRICKSFLLTAVV